MQIGNRKFRWGGVDNPACVENSKFIGPVGTHKRQRGRPRIPSPCAQGLGDGLSHLRPSLTNLSSSPKKTPGPTPQGFTYLLYPICDLLAAAPRAAQRHQATDPENQ